MKEKIKIFDDKKYIFIISTLIIVLFLLFYGPKLLSIIPYFKIKHIVIDGNSALSRQDVLDILNVEQGQSIISYDKDAAIKRFQKTNVIKNVSIISDYPDTIKVVIRERVPVACVKMKINNKTFYYLVDDEAKVVSKRLALRNVNLPLMIIPYDRNNIDLTTNVKKTLYTLNVISYSGRRELKRIKQIEVIPSKNIIMVWLDDMQTKFIVKDFLRVRDFLEMKYILKRSEVSERNFRTIDLRFNDIIAR
mgnify:CR=1 FL=1